MTTQESKTMEIYRLVRNFTRLVNESWKDGE